MARLLIAFLVLYPLWLTTAFLVQRRVVFPRHITDPAPDNATAIKGLEVIWLDTEVGRIEVWYVPGDGVDAEHPGPLLFYAHGNAELIDYWPFTLHKYRRMGVSVALVEYRGYGRSAGTPSQAGITSDYVQAYDLLTRRPEVDKSRIVYHGRSIGAGVVCSLADHRPPAAMILQSPMTAVRDIAGHYLIPGFLVRDPFDNRQTLARLNKPVLILHGKHDVIIPLRHGRALLKAAPNARLIEYACGHNDFPVDSSAFWADIDGFLQEHEIRK